MWCIEAARANEAQRHGHSIAYQCRKVLSVGSDGVTTIADCHGFFVGRILRVSS